jgi:Protein of unknown function (DUF732)
MRKSLKVALVPVVALIALTGCSHDTPKSASVQYMEHLESAGFSEQPGQDLVAAGYQVCQWFDSGMTGTEVLLTASSSGVPAELAGAVIAGAMTDLCPQYAAEMLASDPGK